MAEAAVTWIAYSAFAAHPSCTACCSALYAGRWAALPAGGACCGPREPALHGPGTCGPSCSTSRDLQRALLLALLRHLIKAGIWTERESLSMSGHVRDVSQVSGTEKAGGIGKGPSSLQHSLRQVPCLEFLTLEWKKGPVAW